MRKTTVTIAVLVLLTLGYAGWPFYDLYRFVGAVDRGDVAGIMRAVDYLNNVKEIDPLAERVIMRCLEKDPKARPTSAVQVALALPGGDPLQAALAMGETPSPEMVAASGQKVFAGKLLEE